ncbi:DUF1906 domain-containing protein [Cryobacterium sp. TMT1-2-1]|uniref:glycoside hydrolase domain-containing protein n=1 Tax=Cryobacterium sp. TMT1-2-1 TaxID=1259232 RepID=UPI00106CDA9B|nr:glycoside hydrolase domain-containing protein [Cryobacterium sp. TMT1-2-1]TFD49054.1 DUF1906 domain-containing protein [Cryobacterium sp. TMT1-2-1]
MDKSWRALAAVVAATLAAALAAATLIGPAAQAVQGTAPPASAAALPAQLPAGVNVPAPGTYAGPGFDACSAPAPDLMAAWLTASPYRAVGIYIGGVNRFCTQPQLTPAWVSAQQAAGWHLVPIYLGLQPYCTTSNKEFRFTAANAAASGRAAAGDAVARASALGLGRGSAIFNDIEAYSTTDPVCRQAVLTFQSAWTTRLHDLGYLSGFYSSLSSGVADQVAVYGSTAYVRPDYLWFARYDGVATVENPAIPGSYWPHRRIKQYQNPALTGGPETWGGKTLEVDRNQLDVTPVPATAFGDFTGNGWSDLISRQTATGYLFLYPGNGTGLGSPTRIGSGWNGLDSISRLGDFNRDGKEDVLARDPVTGALLLYRGTGSGFVSRLTIGSGWNGMREITPSGDINLDGYPDLFAVAKSTRCLYYYRGRGTSLLPGVRLGCGWNAMSELVGLGDFTRDGRIDLAARTTATGELWLYPGTATVLGARSRIGTSWNTMRDLVGVGDFDRDGFTDLVAIKSATGELFRYPGRGTSLGTALRIGTSWTGMRPIL